MTTEEEPVDPGTIAAEACQEPFEKAWTELTEALRDTVVGVVRAGAERHRQVMVSQGLASDPPEEWKVRAERLLEYRRAVDAELLTPLVEVFSSRGPTAVVERALEAARGEAVARCQALPPEVDAPWPAGALDAKPSDGWRRRFGKVFARLVSGARRTGRVRPVPLRAVAADHLEHVVVPGQDRLATSVLQSWSRWSRRLEWAWVRWGVSAMPALIRAERPEEEEGGEIWTAVGEAAQALQTELEALSDDSTRTESAAAADAELAAARDALEAELAVAGSFLLRPTNGKPMATLQQLGAWAEALREWDSEVGARMQLYGSLLGILSGATEVRRRTVWRFRDDCLTNVGELRQLAAKLEALRAELVQPGEYGLRTRLDGLDAEIAAAVDSASRAIPGRGAVDSALRELSDTTIDTILEMIRRAPASLQIHDVQAQPPRRGRKTESRPLPLQELARQSFDALRIERIRSSTSGLVDAINSVRADVGELGKVYSFARDEALRELESTEPEAGDRADDLVGGALHSIAEALNTQVTALDAAVATAQRRLAAEIADGSMALVDRAAAGRMGARLLAARSRVSDLWARVQDRWIPPLRRATRRLLLRVERLRKLAAQALRKGSAIVGSAPPTPSSTQTLRALADTKALIETLPLVYQRLFTLAPLSDGALLAGREAELQQAMRRWKRWHDDDGVPLIVRARQGSGITSFLNVFRAEIQRDGGTVSAAVVRERLADECALARFLAELVGLDPVDSLQQLSSQIFEADPGALPAVVSLDNLEHLYLRIPGGTDLIERLLTLMAETEPRIFWIGGISASAWKLVGTAEPSAVSQVDVFDLQPLGESAMRAAIIVRHRRSGLALHYEEPTGGVHRLRRRWRQLRHAEVVQSQLEKDFFERLYRTSGGHLRLALFQWLAVADFMSGDGVLMRRPERPDFSLLDTLTLSQNFTLKAFLEHRSLSLEEHDRIFRLSRQESYQVIESLRNRHLLELLPIGGEDPDARSEIEEELRYRVRPLLTGAVFAHLQGLNIVH